MVDDAHDLDFGRAARADVPLRIGTLSKAIGAYGGYLCASQPVIDLIRNRARTLIYSTGLPPAIVAAAIAALDLIEREPARARAAARQGARLHRGRRPAAGAERDRAGGDRRGRGRAATRRNSWRRKASWWSRSGRRPCRRAPRGCGCTFSAAHPDAEIARLAEIVRTRILGNA